MQGLSARTGAHSFGQHWLTTAADHARAGVNFERLQVICKAGEYRKCNAGAVNLTSYGTTAVFSTRYLTKPVGRRCVSVEDGVATEEPLLSVTQVKLATTEDGVATEEPVLSVTEDKLATSDEVPVEEGSTVKVKFVLQKECHFGQRFNVVGNDPLFGNWNPEAAIPMDWSDGHIWTVEVDVPLSKQVEFKFVLVGQDGEIEWQPGPNQSLEMVEDVSSLVVDKSWDVASEDSLVEVSEELDSTGEETAPVIAGPDEELKEQISAEIESKKDPEGENNGQFPPSESDLLEESESASEVPVADVALAATIVEAALKIDNAA